MKESPRGRGIGHASVLARSDDRHLLRRVAPPAVSHSAVPTPGSSSAPEPPASVEWFIAEVQPHESALKSWLRARFPWLSEVDDVAQEAAVRLWRRQTNPNRTPLASAKAALFAIARNAVIDRARRRHPWQAVEGAVNASVPDESAGVVEIVAARQELEFFAAALRELPTRCRQVVTLTKVYGLSEREVAGRLGISAHTVRTQVIRGMERCDAYLRRHGIERGQHGRR